MPTLIPYGGTIVTNTSALRPGGGGVGSIFGDVNFVPEEGPPEENPSGDVGGPNTGADPHNTEQNQHFRRITECEMFANIVAELASQFKNAEDFVQALRDKFTQDKDRLTWGSEGFKPRYKDDVGPGNSPNQVRHYVGGLNAGFTLGNVLRELAANFREINISGESFPNEGGWPEVPKPDVSPSGEADMRLNAVSAPHGVDLKVGRLKPADLADKIRKEVCQ